jgi:hypothetical protein
LRYTHSPIRDISDILKVTGTKSFQELKDELERLCSDVASRFSLYYPNNTPRRATIIETLAGSSCTSCIFKRLSNTAAQGRIDGIYLECHRLAVSTLAEELQNQFSDQGYVVSIANEYEKEFGKVDVFIRITNYGIHLQSKTNELMVEVKTGFSISLPQIFRYLLDTENETIIVWRIRNRQVLLFDGTKFKLLLMRFMKTCILRANRLLASTEPKCGHYIQNNDWSPTEKGVQEMLEDFAIAIVETLPHVAEKVFETLGENRAKPNESPFPDIISLDEAKNNVKRRKKDPKQKDDSLTSDSPEK